MKIQVLYYKTQKTVDYLADAVSVGPGGITWELDGYVGFLGFSTEWEISIVKLDN